MQPELNHAPDIPLPMLTLNHQGRITSANIEAQSRLNISESALLDEHIGRLFSPESEIKAIMQHFRDSGQPLSDHGLCLRSSGEPCALHMGACSDGYMLIMIPEANRQEHNLHARRQEMAEAVARIALEMAHEVKNPLAALRGAAQWLAEQPVSDDAHREAIHIMLGEVDRIRQRIDDFLQLGPRADIGMEQVNIHEMIDDVCRPVDGVDLRRVFDPGLPLVQAHASRLRQAIENLWSNAMEAGASHVEWQTRINPSVRLNGCKGAVLELRISNDGSPIPASLLEQIFEPYVTAKSRGSGLGLALVQRVMLEHKGQVVVQSADGRTVFILRLPLVQQ